MSDVTQVLNAIESGDPQAAEQLLPLVYDELRKLAGQKMANERPGQTLQATSLVHEAYLRLIGGASTQPWNSQGHFFAAAAEAMRRILIDRARYRHSLKAGGGLQRRAIDRVEIAVDEPDFDVLALDEALTQLEKRDARPAQVVKLRFFAGLTNAEVAAALGVSVSTAENDWAYARAWLKVALGGAAKK